MLAFAAGFVMLGLVLRQRRSPQSALAWLTFAALLPYLGVPLFLLFGRRKVRPARGTRIAASTPEPDAGGSRGGRLERLLCSYGLPPATGGNRLRLLTRGEATYAALVDLIEAARRSIAITMFILHPDPVGFDILERLTRKAGEGVRVHLLLDGIGSFTTRSAHLAALRAAGGQVAFFDPLRRPASWGRINLRNHRKIVVVDESRVLSGGINLAAEYIGPEPRTDRWTDLAFVVEGPAVRDHLDLIAADWRRATGRSGPEPREAAPPVDGEDAWIQVVGSGPDLAEDVLPAGILETIFAARERLWLVTPYFIPDPIFSQMLSIAARRGVDVRLLVPAVSNHRVADWVRGPYIRELERSGGRVLLFEKGMLHAKALLADESLALLGSANFDTRSLYVNYEVTTIVYGSGDVSGVRAWMETLMAGSRGGLPAAGPVRELFEGTVRLLAPLL